MTLIEQPSDSQEKYEFIEVPEEQQQPDLAGMLAELGVGDVNDCMIKVYRINESGKEAHCFDMLPDGLEQIEDRLRDAYGKGDYKLKFFLPTGIGNRKAVKKVVKMSIEIPLSAQKKSDEGYNGPDINQAMQAMTKAIADNNIQMMNAMREQNLESQVRMHETLLQVATTKQDTPSMFEMFKMFKELQPESRDPFGEFRTFMEFQRELKEDLPPADNSTLGTLTSGLNSLMKIAADAPKHQQPAQPAQPGRKVSAQPHPQMPVKQAVTGAGQSNIAQFPQQGVQMPVQGYMQPPQTPQIPQSQPPQPENPFMNQMMLNVIRTQLAMLVTKASENKDPQTYANLIIEELPPQYYPDLLQQIGENNEQGLRAFSQVNPDILNYPEWFSEFMDIIREAFALADEETGEQKIDLDEVRIDTKNEQSDDTLSNSVTSENADQSTTTQSSNTD